MVAPTIILLFSVGAIHESPAFVHDNRSFSGGETPPLPKPFHSSLCTLSLSSCKGC